MPSTTGRYPLSTPDGSAIPLEIMKPHSLVKKSFVAGASSAAIAVPDGVEILSIITSADCLVCFGTPVVSLVDGVNYPDVVMVDAAARICIAPKTASFTITGLTDSGVVYVQFIDKWAGLALQTQYNKR